MAETRVEILPTQTAKVEHDEQPTLKRGRRKGRKRARGRGRGRSPYQRCMSRHLKGKMAGRSRRARNAMFKAAAGRCSRSTKAIHDTGGKKLFPWEVQEQTDDPWAMLDQPTLPVATASKYSRYDTPDQVTDSEMSYSSDDDSSLATDDSSVSSYDSDDSGLSSDFTDDSSESDGGSSDSLSSSAWSDSDVAPTKLLWGNEAPKTQDPPKAALPEKLLKFHNLNARNNPDAPKHIRVEPSNITVRKFTTNRGPRYQAAADIKDATGKTIKLRKFVSHTDAELLSTNSAA